MHEMVHDMIMQVGMMEGVFQVGRMEIVMVERVQARVMQVDRMEVIMLVAVDEVDGVEVVMHEGVQEMVM